MKKVLVGATALSLLLAGCGQGEEQKKDETKTIEKSTEEKATTEKPTTEKPTTEQPKTEALATEEVTLEVASSEISTNEQRTTEVASVTQHVADINNVTDRSTLEFIIYGNYSEVDKITAYKSAVYNGIIPQGNVMEGPALKAYESSLRIETGAEKSVYTTNPNPDNPAAAKYDQLYNSNNGTDNIDSNYISEPDRSNAERNMQENYGTDPDGYPIVGYTSDGTPVIGYLEDGTPIVNQMGLNPEE